MDFNWLVVRLEKLNKHWLNFVRALLNKLNWKIAFINDLFKGVKYFKGKMLACVKILKILFQNNDNWKNVKFPIINNSPAYKKPSNRFKIHCFFSRGLTPSEAEFQFLSRAKGLELYGVSMHTVLVSFLVFSHCVGKLFFCGGGGT